MTDEHVIMCRGACVRIQDGEVEVLEEPRVLKCPLNEALYGIVGSDKETLKKIVEAKIKTFGLCCESRIFDDASVVPYGTSEIIKVAMESGLLECAVVVSDGAGTIITSNPSLVQSIGARLTGIVRTSPIASVMKYVGEKQGVILDANTAKINQLEGFKKAVDIGYRKIAVTVAGFRAKEISEVRSFADSVGIRPLIFSICNTCVEGEDATHLLKADVVCASASRIVREKVGSKAIMQLGVAIPVFVLTQEGKRIILEYLLSFKDEIVVFRDQLPYLVPSREPVLK